MFAILIAGLVLWTAAHLFKRVAPDLRARLGDPGRGLVAAALIASLGLMIWGYGGIDFIPVWNPPTWTVHLNNLMMLGAVFLFGLSATTGRLRGRLRHPQLLSVIVWALAHLLVNGDLASIVLFGWMLAWALAEIRIINASEEWDRPLPGEASRDKILVIVTLVVFALITAVHAWLGVWPFPS